MKRQRLSASSDTSFKVDDSVIDLASAGDESDADSIDAIFVDDSDESDEYCEIEDDGRSFIEISDDDDDDHEDEPPSSKAATPKRYNRATLYVHIDQNNVPSAPGRPSEEEQTDQQPSSGAKGDMSTGVDCDPERLAKIKARIAKILDRGLHPNTPDHEAQKSMRLAQRMLAKFNLSQACVMEERDGKGLSDEGTLQGGMVTTGKEAERKCILVLTVCVWYLK